MAKQVFRGQDGRAIVKLFDDDNRETRVFDTTVYESSDEGVATIADEDADPLDAVIETHANGVCTFTVTVDTRIGEDVNHIVLQSEELEVIDPPPGEAVSGTFELEFTPVEP